LQDVELREVVDVLGAVFVSGAEGALLPCRQARHVAAVDRPAGNRVRWVSEELVVQPGLAAVSVRVEGNRVDIHPALARCLSSILTGSQSVSAA
jgi:hypothetical protein